MMFASFCLSNAAQFARIDSQQLPLVVPPWMRAHLDAPGADQGRVCYTIGRMQRWPQFTDVLSVTNRPLTIGRLYRAWNSQCSRKQQQRQPETVGQSWLLMESSL